MTPVLITATVQRYSPAADAWEVMADMTAPRCFPAAVVRGDFIYVLGGRDADEWGALDDNGERFATVFRYDPAGDTWEEDADMPTARARFAAVVL